MQGVELLSSRTLLAILVLSIVINAFLAYRIFDTAISLDHCRSEQAYLKQRRADALAVIEKLTAGTTKEKMLSLATVLSKEGFIVKNEPSSLQICDIVFSFEDGKVSSVDYL